MLCGANVLIWCCMSKWAFHHFNWTSELTSVEIYILFITSLFELFCKQNTLEHPGLTRFSGTLQALESTDWWLKSLGMWNLFTLQDCTCTEAMVGRIFCVVFIYRRRIHRFVLALKPWVGGSFVLCLSAREGPTVKTKWELVARRPSHLMNVMKFLLIFAWMKCEWDMWCMDVRCVICVGCVCTVWLV